MNDYPDAMISITVAYASTKFNRRSLGIEKTVNEFLLTDKNRHSVLLTKIYNVRGLCGVAFIEEESLL